MAKTNNVNQQMMRNASFYQQTIEIKAKQKKKELRKNIHRKKCKSQPKNKIVKQILKAVKRMENNKKKT